MQPFTGCVGKGEISGKELKAFKIISLSAYVSRLSFCQGFVSSLNRTRIGVFCYLHVLFVSNIVLKSV